MARKINNICTLRLTIRLDWFRTILHHLEVSSTETIPLIIIEHTPVTIKLSIQSIFKSNWSSFGKFK